MGESSNPSFLWFRDLWTCPWLPKPIILIIFGDTRTPKEHQKISSYIFKKYIFANLENLEIHIALQLWKDGRRQISKIRLIKSWKSWIWDQYLPRNMKWTFGNMVPISFKNIQGFSKLWNQETRSMKWNFGNRVPISFKAIQGLLKLWNQQTNNCQTKKARNKKQQKQETKNPWTQ